MDMFIIIIIIIIVFLTVSSLKNALMFLNACFALLLPNS